MQADTHGTFVRIFCVRCDAERFGRKIVVAPTTPVRKLQREPRWYTECTRCGTLYESLAPGAITRLAKLRAARRRMVSPSAEGER